MTGENALKVAAAAYPLDWFDDWSDYETKLDRWVAEAAGAGAELLVFPEYGAMELASLGGREVAAHIEGALREVDRHKAGSDAMMARLAARVEALEAAPRAPDAFDLETIYAISAAVAAYLGEKPHIRQIRLVGSTSWAQQGRATVQASHKLPVRIG